MGHSINALIGRANALAELVQQFGAPAPTELAFDLVIVPLGHQRLDTIAMSKAKAYEGFTYLTPQMAQRVARMLKGDALYIETNYFGGIGSQAAAFLRTAR